MKHGDAPLYLLMNMPNRDFILEIKNDYIPLNDMDNAGLVIYRDSDNRVELLEYYDEITGVPVNYEYMRIQRIGDRYIGYGSVDGIAWEIIGSTVAQDMGHIGLVINGQLADTTFFDIEYVKVFADNKFTIGNLTPGMEVQVLDDLDNVLLSGVCQADTDFVNIDISTMTMPITNRIRVMEGEEVKETTSSMEIWGGDTFWYGLIVEVYQDDALIPHDRETSLGHMINGIIESVISIKNPSTDPITNVQVAVSKYFAYEGYEWVKLADDVGSAPGVYNDDLFIGLLNPGETRKVWIQIKKDNKNIQSFISSQHKFLLEVTC